MSGATEREVTVGRRSTASAERLWALVADVTRMGEYSPENTGATWVGRATGPAVGARFKGTNRHGKRSWSTMATVTECEPGRRFTFRVAAGPFAVSEWSYRFEPDDDGCRVTEVWTDRRGWLVTTLGGPVSGVADRAAHNRATMETTLERLTTAAEAGGG